MSGSLVVSSPRGFESQLESIFLFKELDDDKDDVVEGKVVDDSEDASTPAPETDLHDDEQEDVVDDGEDASIRLDRDNRVSTVSASCSTVTVKFATDKNPLENDFYLKDLETGDYLWDEFNFQKLEVRTKSACIETSGCYLFDLWDSAGNGLVSPGMLTLTYAGKQIFKGRTFGYGITAYLGDGCDDDDSEDE